MRPVLVALALGAAALAPAMAGAQAPTLLAIWGQSGDPLQYAHPTGICLDGEGNVYVGDVANARIVALTNSGSLITEWGGPSADHNQAWSITSPVGLAADAHAHLFVAEWSISDPQSQTHVQEFTTSGIFVRAVGVSSNSPVAGAFFGAWGIAVGPEGHVHVSDPSTAAGFMRVQTFDNDGVYLGQWPEHALGLATDPAGNVYAAEPSSIHKTTSSGVHLALWGEAGSGPGQLDSPAALALDAAGNVYVADTQNHRVEVFDADGGFLTQWGGYGSAPGQFNRPMGIAVSPDGRVYVADTYNNRIQVFGPLATPTRTDSWGALKSIYR